MEIRIFVDEKQAVFILGLLRGELPPPPKISDSPPNIVSYYYTILGLSLFLKWHAKNALRFNLRVVNM